jgi:hypothetical protein
MLLIGKKIFKTRPRRETSIEKMALIGVKQKWTNIHQLS